MVSICCFSLPLLFLHYYFSLNSRIIDKQTNRLAINLISYSDRTQKNSLISATKNDINHDMQILFIIHEGLLLIEEDWLPVFLTSFFISFFFLTNPFFSLFYFDFHSFFLRDSVGVITVIITNFIITIVIFIPVFVHVFIFIFISIFFILNVTMIRYYHFHYSSISSAPSSFFMDIFITFILIIILRETFFFIVLHKYFDKSKECSTKYQTFFISFLNKH